MTVTRLERRRVRWFFAGLLVTVGLLDVLQTLLAHYPIRDRALEGVIPSGVSISGRTGAVVAGLALLLLARGIARGKHVAWQLTCAVLLASAVFHLVKNLDVEEALIALWVVLGLWWLRGHFLASSDPAALRRGLASIAVAAAVALFYAFAGSWLLRHDLAPGFSPSRTLHHITGSLVLENAYQPLTRRAAWFLGSLPAVAGALLLLGLLQTLRPMRPGATGSLDRGEPRRLLARWGHNPVSWLSVLGGSRRFWLDSTTFIPYRVSRRVAIALGDPVGPPGRHREAVLAFIDFCDRHDWASAFYQVEAPNLYRDSRYTVLPIGSDAVIPVDEFGLEGSARHDLRYALRRCTRDGVEFTFLSGPDAWEVEAEQLRSVSTNWLRSGKGPEMEFSVGTLGSLRDASVTVGLAHAPDGHLLAFVTWLPTPGRNGWALDLMRRRADAPNGVMEALIARSLEEARRRRLREVSLGVAPLALEGTLIESRRGRALGLLYRRLGRFRGGRSLHRFKAKFGPRWEPRYLAVGDPAVLPEVLVALVGVHLPRPLALFVEATWGWRRSAPRPSAAA